nr:MAG TPA: hypothetical protein [Crassvirales sp.]
MFKICNIISSNNHTFIYNRDIKFNLSSTYIKVIILL